MLLVDTLQGQCKQTDIPFWFMRQAGRYLPEYKKVRSHFKQFLDFCYTPDAACEVTLQPIDRFNMSAAIIFSDILVIPHGLGADVWFEEKHGPRLKPVELINPIANLSTQRMQDFLDPVYEAIRLCRKALPADKTLIGFCGSPWTLACYMVEGSGSRDFASVRTYGCKQPEKFTQLIELLSEAVVLHANKQIQSGANVIQLFDSWSGVLSEREFEQWVIAPTKRIVKQIRSQYPNIPIIGFPRMSGEKIRLYVEETSVDAVSVDGSLSLDYIRDSLQKNIIVQGNLDPILLAEDKNAMLIQAKHILDKLGKKPFIFNLAHGIVPQTPIENVQALCDLIREAKCG